MFKRYTSFEKTFFITLLTAFSIGTQVYASEKREKLDSPPRVRRAELYAYGERIDKDSSEAFISQHREALQVVRKDLAFYYEGLAAEKGIEREKDYKIALKAYHNAERYHKGTSKDLQVNYRLARMYEKGKGTERNIPLALGYYEIALEEGDERAAYHLGRLLLMQKITNEGTAKACAYLQKAALKAHKKSYFLANILNQFDSVTEQSSTRNIDYYIQAALKLFSTSSFKARSGQEDVLVQNILGNLFYEGVPQDHNRALQYYKKAAVQGDAVAQFNVAIMYCRKLKIEESSFTHNNSASWQERDTYQKWIRLINYLQELKPIEEARNNQVQDFNFPFQSQKGQRHFSVKNPVNKLLKRAEKGDEISQYKLAQHYENGSKEEQDQAWIWYIIAAEAGHIESKFYLLEQTDAESLYRIGQVYAKGLGLFPDSPKAVRYYVKSANRGHKGALMCLEELASCECIEALMGLGEMYWKGQGVQKDFVQACKWLAKALNFFGSPSSLETSALYKLKEIAAEGIKEALSQKN